MDRYLADPSHAAFAFGFQSPKASIVATVPRLAFQYFVRINLNSNLKSFYDLYYPKGDAGVLLMPFIRSVTLPQIKIDTDAKNQYNSWSLVQTKLHFDPVNLVMYDVADSTCFRFWKMYYHYYFNYDQLDRTGVNGQSTTIIDSDIYSNIFSKNDGIDSTDSRQYIYLSGMSLRNNKKYLIDNIEIYQVHGGKYRKTVLVKPRIESFSQTDLAFDASTTVSELTFGIKYENVLYFDYNDDLTTAQKESAYRHSYHQEVKSPNAAGVDKMTTGRNSNVLDVNTTPEQLRRDNSNILVNLQENVSGFVDSLPTQISRNISSQIFTGDVEFPVNYKAIGNTIAKNLKRDAIGQVRQVFTATVKEGLDVFLDTDRTSDNTDQPGDR